MQSGARAQFGGKIGASFCKDVFEFDVTQSRQFVASAFEIAAIDLPGCAGQARWYVYDQNTSCGYSQLFYRDAL
ncbi:hypothetical protein AO057_01590 [Curvibacter sp. PAE-UM]|nr:hypothetical protein AO057_01590 [Curvibacter sp. PAE-UM]